MDQAVLERENRILRKKLARAEKNLRRLEDYRDRADEFHRQLSQEFQTNETRLRQSEHAAHQANQAKSTFLATMSHELRTPLNAIIAYSDLLVDEPALQDDPALIEDVREIQRAGHHLLGLIESVLNLSRIEAGHIDLLCETATAQEVVADVSQLIEPLARRNNNTLSTHLSDPGLSIRIDRLRLRQVLLNLLGNAVKFTRNGLIRFHVRCTGSDQVQFIVEDTGIGIPTESCARIFEPFYQVRESANPSGVGLGLSVSAQLCQRMGGDISVESVVGEGTRFVVNLPQHCECHG